MKLLDLILPVRCVVCDTGGEQLCPACRSVLPRLAEPSCARCGAPTAWPVARCRECAGRRLAFASARAAVAYDEAVRQLVRAWKERGLRTIAVLAADVVAEALPAPTVAALAFVPGDPARGLGGGDPPAAGAGQRARAAAPRGRGGSRGGWARGGRSRSGRCSAGRDPPRGSAGCH